MKKKKLFLVNDASFLSSGYGVYGKELLTRLHNSDKFEVAELGCFAGKDDERIKTVPWRFYPNAVDSADPRHKTYLSSKINSYGQWRFSRCLLDWQPDIVFDVRDYWMSAYQENHPFRKHYQWVIMPTVDSYPQRTEWLYTFANADLVVPYTEWAKKTLIKQCGRQIKLFPDIVNAGINTNEYFPIKDKVAHKIKHFGKDIDVVGVVMRNQNRKLFPELFFLFRKFLDSLKGTKYYERMHLYIHTTYPEGKGWDLPSLLLEYGLLDRVYISYKCEQCNKFFPSKFQTAITDCRFCNKVSAIVACPNKAVDTTTMNEIYNLFDFFLQYSICEGFGMPQIEAAAAGIPLASVDYSAMSEIVRNLGGTPIPVQKFFREQNGNADRAYPDNNETIKILREHFLDKSEEEKQKLSETVSSNAGSQYTWDQTYERWERALDSVDIKRNVPWNAPKFEINSSATVPPNLNPRDCAEFICNVILNEPYACKTSGVQQLIRDLQLKMVAQNGAVKQMNYQMLIHTLENLLTNKVGMEEARTDYQNGTLKNEDYLRCQK